MSRTLPNTLRLAIVSVAVISLSGEAAWAQPVPRETRTEARNRFLRAPRINRIAPDPSVESIGLEGLSEITIGFDEPVRMPPKAVSVWGIRAGEITGFSAILEPTENAISILFAAPVHEDVVSVVLDDSIVDLEERPLDGEIRQPSQPELPSGDFIAGGQAVLRFGALTGDVDRNGIVDGDDGDRIRRAFGRRSEDPGFDPDADLNADDLIDAIDVQISLSARGNSLPTTDGIAPRILARVPANGSTRVAPVLDAVALTFDEPVRGDSFTASSLAILTPEGRIVSPASVSLEEGDTRATFLLSPPLATDGVYRFSLSNAIADDSGELMRLEGHRWHARLESTLTRVASSSPANGESDIALTRETIVEFSRSIRPSEVSESSVFASFGGSRLAARLHTSSDARRVSLFYSAPLPSNARVRVTIDGDALHDDLGNPVDADGDLTPGGVGFVDFDTLTLASIPGTVACGRVFASELSVEGGSSVNVALEGATITIDGMGNEPVATTDALGNFRVDPAPAGKFFVHVHGISRGDGSFYPTVGKPWTTVPGVETNVGDVFLPLIVPDTLQPISQTKDTTIYLPESVRDRFPKVSDVRITVPAGSLFADDGSPGEMAGIGLVPPDRLPGRLPDDLAFPVVITVQTAGASNFDIPVPAAFPNLADPTTGNKLPPGAKSALWSFNHDSGAWEIVGPMTVSADGLLVVTDPGVGIRAPGWHGAQPGARVSVPGGSCDSVGRWLGTAKELFGCLRELSVVFKALETGIAIAKEGQRLLESLEAIRLAYESDRLSTCGLKAAYSGLLSIKRQLVLALAVFEESSPVSRALALFGCIANLADAVANAICGDGECILIPFISSDLCRLTTDVTRLIAHGANLLTAYQDGLRQLAIGSICGLLDELEVRLEDESCSATGDPREAILALLIQLENETRLSVSLASRINETRPTLQDLESKAQSTYSNMEALVTASGGLRNSYFKVSVDSDVLRGRTGPNGGLDLRMRAESEYLIEVLVLQHNALALSSGRTPSDGQAVQANPFSYRFLDDEPDSDLDGIADIAEPVVGTDSGNADSDGDGLRDGAEVLQGTDPLDGLTVRAGIIATASVPGTSVDVVALNDVMVVAAFDRGVSILNAFNGMEPRIIAQVETPGSAVAVARAGNRVAVADYSGGFEIIDITDPPAARIVTRLAPADLGGFAQAVATAGDIAFVGTTLGSIVCVDLRGGVIIQVTDTREPVHDLFVEGRSLFALGDDTLRSFSFASGALVPSGSVDAPGLTNTSVGRKRLFVGGGVAYVVHATGYATFDVTDSAAMSPIGNDGSGQIGWKRLVTNGAGVGIAAVSPNMSFDGPHNVARYDVSDPTRTNVFLEEIVTPGVARSVAIYNGLAYVADGSRGLQVINYLPFDSVGIPPAVALTLEPDVTRVTEGDLLLLRGVVSDDVQVRNVSLMIDGALIETDGSFPFEFHLTAPRVLEGETRLLSISLRATDTGGNASSTNAVEVEISRDAIPPRVALSDPAMNGSIFERHFETRAVSLQFSEAMDPSLGSSTAATLTFAGLDEAFGTGDDQAIPLSVSLIHESRTLVVRGLSATPIGLYELRLESAKCRDSAGNELDGDADGIAGGDYRLFFSVVARRRAFWDGGGDGTTWGMPGNWSEDIVPGPNDEAVVDVPGDATVRIPSGTSVAINRIRCAESLIVAGQLVLDSASEVNGPVTMQSGSRLSGVGDLFVNGPLSLSGSTLQGSGRLLIATGSTVSSSGSASTLSRRCENAGTMDIAASLVMSAGMTFVNLPTGRIRLLGSGLTLGGADTVVLFNMGMIERQGSGSFEFPSGTKVDNSGTFLILQGQLVLSAFESSGQLEIRSGASVTLRAACILKEGWAVTGEGALVVDGGTIEATVSGTIDVASTSFGAFEGASGYRSGGLTGIGDVTFSRNVTLIQGTMSGSGRVTFEASATVQSVGTTYIVNRSVVNEGSVRLFRVLGVQGNGAVTNYGILTLETGGGITGDGRVVNRGTIERVGTGSVECKLGTLENRGTITVLCGTSCSPTTELKIGELTNYGIIDIGSMAKVTLINDAGSSATFESGWAITGDGSLVVDSVTMMVKASGAIDVASTSFGAFEGASGYRSGGLTGIGDVTFSRSVTLIQGAMSGSGRVTFESSASVQAVGSSYIVNRSVINEGSVRLFRGLDVQGNGEVTNHGMLTLETGGGIGGVGRVVNHGTIARVGTGPVECKLGALENRGTITVRCATSCASTPELRIGRLANYGIIDIGSMTTVTLFNDAGSSPTFESGWAITGDGSLVVDTVTMMVNASGAIDVASTSFGAFEGASGHRSGGLTGIGDVTFSRNVTLIQGTMSGGGRVTFEASAAVQSVGSTYIVNRSVVNEGSVRLFRGLDVQSNGEVTNHGMLTLETGGGIGGGGRVVNQGAIARVGTGQVSCNLGSFENRGTLTVRCDSSCSPTPELRIGRFTNHGIIDIGAMTKVTLFNVAGSSPTFEAGWTIVGDGALVVDNVTMMLNASGTIDVASTTFGYFEGGADATPGSITGPGDVTLGGNVILNRGTMSGAGSLVVSSTGNVLVQKSGYTLDRHCTNDGVVSASKNLLFGNGRVFTNRGVVRVNPAQATLGIGGANSRLDNAGTLEVLPGTLNVLSVFTQTSGSAIVKSHVAGTPAGLQGVLSLNSTPTLDGVLVVAFDSPFVPSVGSCYQVLSFVGPRSTDFASVMGENMPEGTSLAGVPGASDYRVCVQ